MLQFTPLTVTDVRRETRDSVSVGLRVPTAQRQAFRFAAGQYLTLRSVIDGEDVRRSYSLCIAPALYEATGELRVGVKQVAGGRFSTFINRRLQPNDQIDALPPEGRFTTNVDAAHALHYVGFAGGSGITPILSLASTLLACEPRSRFTLIYGNRTVNSIMFVEALEDLKDRFLNRFVLHHVLSDEPQEVALHHGLLNEQKCTELLAALLPAASIDKVFVCGPDPMMDAVQRALLAHGVPEHRILIERFGVPMPASGPPTAATTVTGTKPVQLSIIVDGKTRHLALQPDETVLEAGLAAGLPLPYACKAGVCCTCKAKVLVGRVQMIRNFTLTEQEARQGFVLTCQSLCQSEELVVSYDER